MNTPRSLGAGHPTLLRALGIDHKCLTYRCQGRDFRLTDVYGNVVPELLA